MLRIKKLFVHHWTTAISMWCSIKTRERDGSEKKSRDAEVERSMENNSGRLGGGRKAQLPPGPPIVPFITAVQWIGKSISDVERTLRHLSSKYGPIISLGMNNSKPLIFITTHDLSYQSLVTRGAIFADRPPAPPASRYLSNDQHTISAAPYGPLRHLLRRNLTFGVLQSSRVNSYAHTRKSVLQNLKNKLKKEAAATGAGGSICVGLHFQYAIFCLLVIICFGDDKLDEKTMGDIEKVQRDLPAYQLQYLRLPEGGRKLSEREIVGLCSELLNAGTDTTATTLEWIMANLVKHQDIQLKLFEEIKGVVQASSKSGSEMTIQVEDIQKMPYLKAVVLEGLRRHPPGHFVLPHAVTEDTMLEGYVVPKDAIVHFMIGEMAMDSKVWDNPMEFKPERFLSSSSNKKNGEIAAALDIAGSRDIKIMPFGAGRRICPGLGLAMLHLEYFVANLVMEFQWACEVGHEVDLSEKQVLTVVMKKPLRARLLLPGVWIMFHE
ncbi:hypothetical protein IFM89_012499 [Coptis chinensis]|uniref:Cytochrome P450 n=1 Tax=Coptis chinensis TaxID=261450 RepID=A0A835I1W6_9MAGN|nr:hypothetical protein IFM89_012499 [Coptis chinensis]